MPDSGGPHAERDSNPFSRPSSTRRGLIVSIKLDNEKSINSYTTLDTISGIVEVIAEVETSFDQISISFEGSSRTVIEQPSVVAPSAGRRTAFHTFLRLVQPVKPSFYPENGKIKPGKVYAFPFTFVIPEHLLPQACSHNHHHPQLHESHTFLPPSLGDPMVSGNGQALMDDMAPDACHIQYMIRSQLVRNIDNTDRRSWAPESPVHEGQARVIAAAIKRIRVVPATDEYPPMIIGSLQGTDYCLRQEKEVKKGTLRGRLGTIAMSAAQPRAFKVNNYPFSSKANVTPPSTVVTVNLRFDPIDAKQKPPKLGILFTRMKVHTFYSAVPWTVFPEKHSASKWDLRKGVHTVTIPLASRRVTETKWAMHEAPWMGARKLTSSQSFGSALQRPDMKRALSAGTVISDGSDDSVEELDDVDTAVDLGLPGPTSRADASLPYYTASIIIPLTLPEKSKTYLPTFHSCLTSRTYSLDVSLTYHSPSKTSTPFIVVPAVSLKLPVQISTAKSLSALSEMSAQEREAERQARAAVREARRQRHERRNLPTSEGSPRAIDVEEFFSPRSIAPPPLNTVQTESTPNPSRSLFRAPSGASNLGQARRSRLTGASDDPMSPSLSFDPTTPFDPTSSLRHRRSRSDTISSTHSNTSEVSLSSTVAPPEYTSRQDAMGRRFVNQHPLHAQS